MRIEGAGRRRRLAWTLSEPGPASCWAVLKSDRGDEFTPVARVQAGPGLEMSWADDSPPAGHARYKVRSECVDTRYQWESAETGWPDGGRKPIITGLIPNPVGAAVALVLAEAAPGAFKVRLYDLQGRVVLEQRAVASGERQRLTLEIGAHPASLPNGIYFLRVTDAAGLESDPVKLVILR